AEQLTDSRLRTTNGEQRTTGLNKRTTPPITRFRAQGELSGFHRAVSISSLKEAGQPDSSRATRSSRVSSSTDSLAG
ncbi:hypothetical protein L9F63_027636, partial [Diploptera punctata]